jgi:hypothetical protein
MDEPVGGRVTASSTRMIRIASNLHTGKSDGLAGVLEDVPVY